MEKLVTTSRNSLYIQYKGELHCAPSESFRSNSEEAARKSLSKRNKDSIVKAIYTDTGGKRVSLI